MNKAKFTLSVLASVLFIVTCATAGQAFAQRTFVAGPGIGNDANTASDCSFSAPCRNFSAAYGVTNIGGEIIALSPGVGYGGLSITHAITVTGLPGQVAFVAVTAGVTGFSVSAPGADLVVVKNISFNGSNAGASTGLTHTGGKLVIEGCNFSQLAVGFNMSAVGSKANILNSTFSANVIGLKDSGGHVKVDRSAFTNNTVAIRGEGDGGYSTSSVGSPVNHPIGPTLVRIASSIINDNTTAFQMHNAGFRPSGQCNGANIMLHQNPVGENHITGNGTFVVVDGTTEVNSGCGASTVPPYNDQP